MSIDISKIRNQQTSNEYPSTKDLLCLHMGHAHIRANKSSVGQYDTATFLNLHYASSYQVGSCVYPGGFFPATRKFLSGYFDTQNKIGGYQLQIG